MRHSALPLVVVLLAAFGYGRTASDKDTARAIQGARQLHDRVSNPDSLEVSQAFITGKSVCIDYRSRTRSGGTSEGIAVYEADKKLLFLDNSWMWQRSCLFGKYGQRREGADVTEAMNGALKRPEGPALNQVQEAVVQAAPRAKPRPVLKPRGAAAETRIVTAPPAPPEPAAAVAPVQAASVVEATIETAPVVRHEPPARPVVARVVPAQPVETVAPVAQAPVKVVAASAPVVAAPVAAPVVEATVAAAPAMQPEPVARPAVMPAAPAPPVEASARVTRTPAQSAIASVPAATAPAPPQPAAAPLAEIHVVGAVIIGPGAGTPPPAAQESLADAARRLRREKQERQQRQAP